MVTSKQYANQLIEKLKTFIAINVTEPAFNEKNDSFVLLFNDQIITRFSLDEAKDKLHLTAFLAKTPKGLSSGKSLYRFLLEANFEGYKTNCSTFGLEMDEEGDESIVYSSYFQLNERSKIEDEFINYLESFLSISGGWQEAFSSGKRPLCENKPTAGRVKPLFA